LITEMITGAKTLVDPTPFSPRRFQMASAR
jgi:hypothetical protein